jgi:hypothetical protein
LQQRRPIFKAGVELIYVNVVVRDGDGSFRNLKRNFTLIETTSHQTISAFDSREVPVHRFLRTRASRRSRS